MSVSAVAPTPFYQDPERLPIGLPPAQASSGDKTDSAAASTSSDGKRLHMFAAEDDSPSFWDLLDVINPLQHIPVISNLYREATGDQIGVGARLVGGTLFGGPIGLIASAVDCVVEESTGQDTGGHVLALFRDEGSSSPTMQPATQFAQAAQQPAAATPSAAAEAVSSSPAKAAAEEAKNTGAPVIALPEGLGGNASQPMVFTADGLQATAPAASGPAPLQLANAAPVNSQTSAAQAAARYQTSSKGFMPVPPRAAPGDAKPVPQITVPVSNGMQRSNVPITGRSPTNNTPVATAARPQVTQDALSSHPMAPPMDANGQTAAGPDWFTAAWGQALDKYERANQRNGKSTGTSTGATSSTLQ